MMKVYLTLVFFAAAVFAESVRETETWVRTKELEAHDIDFESSGDFNFGNEEFTTNDDEDEDLYDDSDDYEESGSGIDEDNYSLEETLATSKPDLINNAIPDIEASWPKANPVDEMDIVRENEIARSSTVLQNKAEQNIFNNKEVLAAVIAGGAVGLLFAVLLILLLVYRMKKKDEGSYDLGKKPIYKKAPTTEIYA